MKRIFLVAVAMMMVFVMAGGAYAAGTVSPLSQAVSVNAQVKSMCTPVTVGQFLAADILIDPYGGAQNFLPGTAETVKCTKGSTVTVNIGATACNATGVARTLTGTGGLTIPYTFTCSGTDAAGQFTGNGGTAVDLGIGVSLTALAAEGADIAGNNYSDTVTLTLSY